MYQRYFYRNYYTHIHTSTYKNIICISINTESFLNKCSMLIIKIPLLSNIVFRMHFITFYCCSYVCFHLISIFRELFKSFICISKELKNLCKRRSSTIYNEHWFEHSTKINAYIRDSCFVLYCKTWMNIFIQLHSLFCRFKNKIVSL